MAPHAFNLTPKTFPLTLDSFDNRPQSGEFAKRERERLSLDSTIPDTCSLSTPRRLKNRRVWCMQSRHASPSAISVLWWGGAAACESSITVLAKGGTIRRLIWRRCDGETVEKHRRFRCHNQHHL